MVELPADTVRDLKRKKKSQGKVHRQKAKSADEQPDDDEQEQVILIADGDEIKKRKQHEKT